MKPAIVNPCTTLFPRTIDELFNQVWAEPKRASFAPRVDIDETAESYVIRAELPGVDAGEVELTVDAETLTLKGEKTTLTETEDARGHIRERSHGSFSRTFTFPNAISPDDVTASATKGVLEVVVKKAETAKTRRIEIKGE